MLAQGQRRAAPRLGAADEQQGLAGVHQATSAVAAAERGSARPAAEGASAPRLRVDHDGAPAARAQVARHARYLCSKQAGRVAVVVGREADADQGRRVLVAVRVTRRAALACSHGVSAGMAWSTAFLSSYEKPPNVTRVNSTTRSARHHARRHLAAGVGVHTAPRRLDPAAEVAVAGRDARVAQQPVVELPARRAQRVDERGLDGRGGRVAGRAAVHDESVQRASFASVSSCTAAPGLPATAWRASRAPRRTTRPWPRWSAGRSAA